MANGKQIIRAQVSDALYARFDREAKRRGLDTSNALRMMVHEWLDNHETRD